MIRKIALLLVLAGVISGGLIAYGQSPEGASATDPPATDTPGPAATDTPGPAATDTPGPAATDTPGPAPSPTPTATVAPTSYFMAVDCDLITGGVQGDCTYPLGTTTIGIDIVFGKVPPPTTQRLAAFNYDLYNPRADLITPAFAPLTNILYLPSANWSCSSPPPLADTGLGAPGTTTSYIGCFDLTGNGVAIDIGDILTKQNFNVNVSTDEDITLTLSNVNSLDSNTVPLAVCDPTQGPPAVPDPSGPCLTATLHFRQSSTTATPTAPTVTPTATPSGSISGHVYHDAATPGNELAGAYVQACRAGNVCTGTGTDGSGAYTVAGVADGTYIVTSYPPGGYLSGSMPVSVSGGASVSGQDIIVTLPAPPPPGTTVNNQGAGNDLPVFNWTTYVPFVSTACPGGTVTWTLALSVEGVIASGTLIEGPAGTFTGNIPPVYPHHGAAIITLQVDCGGTITNTGFDVYIDPSGLVRTTTGAPLPGASVTLYRSDTADGSFDQVADGSAIMSPANRTNPDVTDAAGHFGWDVVAGFYRVRASFAGCVSPANPLQPYAETAVLTIPPPVVDLDIRLNCAGAPAAPTPCAGDQDCDTVADAADNCGSAQNLDQANIDRNFTDLHVFGWTFDDLTLAKSDPVGDACDTDDDNDGLTDAQETGGPPCASASGQTDPHKADTDGDRVLDGAECALGTDPLNANSKPLAAPPGDTDHDGLPDAFELSIGSNPALPDTDGDKLIDGLEVEGYGTDPLSMNTDGDACADGKEAGSLNDDTKVNSLDQLLVAKSFNSSAGQPKYVVDFDVTKDGKINSTDLLIQAKVFGAC